MKKVIYMAALLLASTTIFSCSKEDVGGTATEAVAGQWVIMVDAVDDDGNPINEGENYFGLESGTMFYTYNTAANISSEVWLDSKGAFNLPAIYGNAAYPNYDIRAKVFCDVNSLTFSSIEAENEAEPYIIGHEDEETGEYIIDQQVDPMPITVNGKILKGAGRQKNGSPADSICIFVQFKDDPWYPDDGYTKYKISGIRYSGLVEND